MPSLGSFVAVGVGAATGAWLRWGLSVAFNPLWSPLPLGTLAANLVGGLLMGFALEVMARYTELSPEWRLLVTTGFLGGLTTFSTFSAEMTLSLLRREWLWTTLGIVVHVVGSIALTLLGILIARTLILQLSAR